MQILRLLPILFVLCSTSGTGLAQHKQSPLTRKYAPAQLQEDADVFGKVVMALHPSPGIYHPRDYYRALLDSFTYARRDSMTEREFRLQLKLIADRLHCGHTEVLYSQEYYRKIRKEKLNYSPYIFIPVQDKVYLIANLNRSKDSTLKSGTEITKINGIPVDSMLRHTRRFISSDGFNVSGKNYYLQLGFNTYYTLLFGRPDTFTVEYTDGQTVKNTKYAAFRPKSMPALPLARKDDSLFTKFRLAAIRYRFLDRDKKTMLMDINRFSNLGEARAYRRIFRKMRRNNTANLVLDLRNNGGGSLANTYRLLSYLLDTAETQTLRTGVRNFPYRKYTSGNVWFRFTRFAYRVIGEKRTVNDTDYFVYTIKPRKKNHFNGQMYVLINGGSFSASSLVAAYLKSTGRATFLGEETGGTMEGCNAGITPYYRLPNTKVRVRVPAFRIVHDVCPKATGRGVEPDLKIEYSLKDLMRKRDLELLKVKELLKIS